MSIHLSASKQISRLVSDLSSDRATTRDGAIARLTVIGERASGPLAALVGNRNAPANARCAALRVFEAIDDPRGLDAALSAIDDPTGDVALAAIAALRPHLRGRRGATAVDSLARTALDPTRALDLREAAVHHLLGLEKTAVRPLLMALRGDPSPRIAALRRRTRRRRLLANRAATKSSWRRRPMDICLETRICCGGRLWRRAAWRRFRPCTG